MLSSAAPNGLLPEFQSAWARYLSLWVTAYEAQGVPVWGITAQVLSRCPSNSDPLSRASKANSLLSRAVLARSRALKVEGTWAPCLTTIIIRIRIRRVPSPWA